MPDLLFGTLPCSELVLGSGRWNRRLGSGCASFGQGIPAKVGRHLLIGNFFSCFPVAAGSNKVDSQLHFMRQLPVPLPPAQQPEQ